MDTFSFCHSTSTAAPMKLGLRLLTCAPLVFAFRFDLTVDCVAFAWILSILTAHVTMLRALIRSWRGVYVCESRCTRTRVQFKNPHSWEHWGEYFGCVRTHFQAFMNQAEIFF